MEGAVFIGFRGFKDGVAGYAHSRKIKFPAPPFGVLFHALSMGTQRPANDAETSLRTDTWQTARGVHQEP